MSHPNFLVPGRKEGYTAAVASFSELCADLPEITLETGEILIDQGKTTEGKIFFLSEGSLEVITADEVSLAVISKPGSVVGEMSLLLDQPHTATVRALEPSRCWVADQGLEFLRTKPEVTFAVAQLLARRLFMSTSYLADIKRQYERHDANLAILDQVLETFTHHQDEDDCEPGSEREREPNI